MAIDDNTSYELTGAQVKDLASKINAKADTTDLPSVMTGATSSTAGTSGLVPAPAAGDENKVLSGAGTWVNQSGGGGGGSVIYYANSTSTAGFQSGTINGPYIYKDAARTTIATPGEIYDNFQAGNSIHIEYESTQTGTSAFAMTLEVATMSLHGSNIYSMILNEVNDETPGDPRDLVMLRLYAYWDGQSTFSSRWTQQRKYVNDGTLTIQQNGTTVGTFTANQSTNTTVNLAGGIYADDPTAPANPDAWITGSDVDWTTTAQSYSTTEVDTGATWIDGRKIYKKTVDCGIGPNNTTKSVAHGISNLRRVIRYEGCGYDSSSCIPLPFTSTNASAAVQVYTNSSNIYLTTGVDRSNLIETYMTLWYTKTTG